MRGILLLCLSMITMCATAQEEFEVIGEVDSTETQFLTEITISANRWEQNIAEVPGKITTISKSQINLENPQTAADLLGISNHVFIQKSQLGGGSPMIRGFATNRVLLVVDGVRMNNAIFRAGNVQNVISIDPNAVAGAEILFGPGAVMYGSDAIGGVMDFHTLRPEFAVNTKRLVKGNGALRYSSANNEKMLHADVNVASQRFASVSSITRSSYDDLRMGSEGPDEYLRPDYVVRQGEEDVVVINDDPEVQRFTGYDQWNVMQKFAYQPASNFEISYAFHFSKTSAYPRYDRLIIREDGELANGEWYYGPQGWTMHSLKIKDTNPTVFADQWKLTAAFQDFDESRHNRGFNGARRTNRFENVKAFSVNLDLEKSVAQRATFFYGAEYVTNKVYSTAYRQDIITKELSPVSTRYPNDSDWRSGSLYGSLRYKINEYWNTGASLRVTNVYSKANFDTTMFDFPFAKAEVQNTAVNASLGMVFTPSGSTKAYLNLSTGFRAPNIDDMGKFFDLPDRGVVVPNPSLKPEYAYNVEAGFAAMIRSVKVDVAAYYTFLDDAIARGYDQFNGQDSIVYDDVNSKVYSLQNISSVTIAGIQAGVEIDVTKRISIRSNASYQKGTEKNPEADDDYSPTHVAPFFGATHVMYRGSKIVLDLYANYNGAINYEDLALSERIDDHLYSKDASGNPYSPSWSTLNLKSTWKVTHYLSVDAGVENILDRRYRPYSSGLSAPGRNFIIALRTKF